MIGKLKMYLCSFSVIRVIVFRAKEHDDWTSLSLTNSKEL